MKKKLFYVFLFVLFFSAVATAQERTITGVVKDNAGLPLNVVSVMIKGTSHGVATDFDGNYSIKVPNDKTVLVFSQLGMKTVEKIVGKSHSINVVLEEEAQELGQVEVVGYVTVKKDQYVGSATSIDKESLKRKSVSNVSQALAGEAAGVRVINTSGQPGREATIRVRGFGSVNGNRDPLYVLDGVTFDGNISSINPEDIENMVILKDATSTSIYGARGANGVVLITTKKGRVDASRIQVESKVGFNMRLLPRYETIGSAEEFIALAWEGLRNRGALTQQANPTRFNALYSSPIDYANKNLFYNSGSSGVGIVNDYNIWNSTGENLIDPNTGKVRDGVTRKYDPENWADYAYQTSIRTEYNVSMSGGSGKTTYYTGLGYLKDAGYAINSGFERYTGRLNLSHQVKPWLNGELSLGYTHSQIKENGQESNNDNVFWFTDNMVPLYPLFLRDANGNKISDPYYGGYQYDFGTTGRGFGGLTNAIAQATLDKKNRTRNELSGNVFFKADIVKGLSFETRLGGQYYNHNINDYTNPYYGARASDNGSIDKGKRELLNYTFLQMLRYTKSFGFGKHNTQVFAAHESTNFDYYVFDATKTGLINPSGTEMNSATKMDDISSYIYNYRLESYFGQFLYDYDGKYLLSTALRRDGSSRYLNDKWGTFASVGLGWVVSKENFLKEKEWLPYLKLKASYGTIGDQSVDGDGGNTSYYPGYDVYDAANFYGLPAASFNRIGYPKLTWEKSKMFQVGTEFSLFKSRAIDIQVDYYHKTTKDLVFDSRLAPSTGNGINKINDGLLINQGIEFNVMAHLFNKGDFKLDLGVNGEILKNKLTKMPLDNTTQKEKILDLSSSNYGRAKDHSLYDFYMREWMGVNPQTGAGQWKMYYTDNNNDGTFNTGDEAISSLYDYKVLHPDANIKEGITEDYSKATQSFVGKSAIPDLRGAVTLRMAYKGISLSTQLLYGIGGYAYDEAYAALMSNNQIGRNNWHTDIRNRWQKAGDITDIPRLSANYGSDANFNSSSTRFLVKSDYLVLNNVTLGYELDKEVCKGIGFEGLAFTLSGDNLWLSTKRKGFNPTTSETGQSSAYRYSPLSTFTLGVKATF